MIKKSLNAFSIAEVLVTMLIVALVVVMTMPVITKKKLNVAAKIESGFWECTIDGNGKHQGSTDSDHSYCIFTPPKDVKVREYSILVIGGGGGGAAGNDSNFALSSYGNSTSAEVPIAANYKYLLIGGGGGGASHYNRVNYTACNGGGAQITSGTLKLAKGAQVHLTSGLGGLGGYTAIGNHDSDEVAIPGLKSILTVDGVGTYSAEGGTAGDANKTTNCASRTLASGSLEQITEFTELDLNAASLIGVGGLGNVRGNKGDTGNNGLAVIKSDILTGGGGGSAGEVVYKTMKTLPDRVIVKVGQGGAGGIASGEDGFQGQPSAFGNYAIATGGKGGKAGAKIVGNVGSIDGAEGEASPLGGKLNVGSGAVNAKNDMDVNNGFVVTASDKYGAGGGGGGYKQLIGRPMPNDETIYGFGKGGRGASGYVRVEWN